MIDATFRPTFWPAWPTTAFRRIEEQVQYGEALADRSVRRTLLCVSAAAGPRRPDTAAAAELFAGLAVRQTAGDRCAGAARCGRRRVGGRRFDVGAIAIGVHCPVGLAKEANDVAHDGAADGGGVG